MLNKSQVSVDVDSRLARIEKLVIGFVNGQSAMKSELLTKIDGLDKKLSGRMDSLDKKMDKGFREVTKRIDKIGLQVANLEDDAPTVEEFDKLETRVTNLESKCISV